MSDRSSRSRSVLADGFTKWFADQHPEWSDIVVAIDRPQPGLSSDTLMLTVETATTRERFVARLPPLGETVFPDYDLVRQANVQNAVAAHGIPAAVALATESDPAWIGSSFVLMPQVVGHTLTTNPPYLTDGWLATQDADRQAVVIERFVDLLASINRLPVDDLDLGDLTGGGPTLAGMLDYWQAFLDWATNECDDKAIYYEAIEWCRANLPQNPPPAGLLWGDPQLTNLVLDDDGGVAAALDFEMAGYGPAEVDLAWFLVLHEHAAETAGAQLPGYPGRAAIIARHEAALGRPLADLGWYDVLANVRTGAIVLRIGELMQQAGHSASWTAQVPQPRHLARLIGAATS
jgi:aminoglycoside phosphotransferase (APT) family kinase protein